MLIGPVVETSDVVNYLAFKRLIGNDLRLD